MWLVGETNQVTITATFNDSVTLSSPTLSVVKPDGTILSPAPTVTVIPTQTALSHTLSAVVPAALAGKYSMMWGYTTSNGQALASTSTAYASFTDVPGLIRRRLNESTQTLQDGDIDPEFEFTVRTLFDRFVPLQMLGTYLNLTGLDQERFDQAAGLLTACRFYEYRAKAVATGTVSQVKMGQNAFVFAPPKHTGKTLQDEWKAEALLALGRVSVVQTQFVAAASSFKPFRVSGPTRYVKTQGEIETLLGGVIRLLTDDWYLTDDYINGDIGYWLG